MVSSTQIRNDEMVGILASDFVGRNDPVFDTTALFDDVSSGATTITTFNAIPAAKGQDFWVVIDPFTDECEVRKVISVAPGGKTFTLGSALTYNHDRYDAVWYIHRPLINVAWFDVESNATTAFIRAFAQVRDNECGLVYIPPGEYTISSIVTVYSHTYVYTEYGTVVIYSDVADNQLFYLGIDGRTDITFDGVILNGKGAATHGGIAIRGHNVSNFRMINCKLEDFNGGGVRLRAPDNILCSNVVIENCEFIKCGQYPASIVNAGVYITGYYYNIKILHCNFWNCYYMGIHIESESGANATTTTPGFIEIKGNVIRDNFASTLPNEALVAPWASILIRGLYATGGDPVKIIGDIVIDSNICRGGYDTISVGWVMRCIISNNIVRNNGRSDGVGGDGIVIFGEADWCIINNNTLLNIAGNGIHLQAGGGPTGTDPGSTDHNIIVGNSVFQYNRGNYVNAGGIALLNMNNASNSCQYNVIVGNRCIATGVSRGYGIADQALAPGPAPNYNFIMSNDVSGNPNGGILRMGPNTITRHNRGFRTENMGTVTLAAGSTSVTVTHGLDRTPAVGEIMIRIQGEPGPFGPEYIRVANITSTTFDVIADAPPAWDTTIAWHVQELS